MINRDNPKYRHYRMRHDIIRRCYNKASPDYHRYGGRGITVCARWRDSLSAFIADMGPIPVGMSIDRIDNDGPYSPGNCRWATPAQQSANSRRAKLITFRGMTKTHRKWAEHFGMNQTTLSARLRRGVPFEDAIR